MVQDSIQDALDAAYGKQDDSVDAAIQGAYGKARSSSLYNFGTAPVGQALRQSIQSADDEYWQRLRDEPEKIPQQVGSSLASGLAEIPAAAAELGSVSGHIGMGPASVFERLGVSGAMEWQQKVISKSEEAAEGIRGLAETIAPGTDLPRGFLTHTGPEAIGQTFGFGVAGKTIKLATGVRYALGIAAVGATTGGTNEFYEHLSSNPDDLDGAFLAFLGGAAVGTTEALSVSKMLARIERATGGGVTKHMFHMLGEGFEEGVLNEAPQAAMSAFLARHLRQEEVDILEEALRGAKLGAFSGIFLGALASVAEQGASRAASKAPQEPAGEPQFEGTPETVQEPSEAPETSQEPSGAPPPFVSAEEAGQASVGAAAPEPSRTITSEHNLRGPEGEPLNIRVMRHADGSATLLVGGKRPVDYNAAFAQTKTDEELVDYFAEPTDFTRVEGVTPEKPVVEETLAEAPEAPSTPVVGEQEATVPAPAGEESGISSPATLPSPLLGPEEVAEVASKGEAGFTHETREEMARRVTAGEVTPVSVPAEEDVIDASEPPPPVGPTAEGSEPGPDPNTQIDEWLGNRWIVEHESDLRAAKHEAQLKEVHGQKADPGFIAGATTDVLKASAQAALGGERGHAVRESDRAIHLHIDLLNAQEKGFGTPQEQFEKYEEGLNERQRELYERSQNLSEGEQAVAREIIEENQAIGGAAMDAEVISIARDFFTRRMWKPISEGAKKGRKFRLSTPSAKARTYESILEGWADGRELAIEGAIAAQQHSSKDVAQVALDRNFKAAAKKSGLFSNIQREGWEEVDSLRLADWAPAATKLGADEMRELNPQNVYVRPDGTVMERRNIYAPKKVARDLNRILGSQGEPMAVEKMNAYLKAQLLSTSFFHHQAFLRSFVLGAPYQNLLSHSAPWRWKKAYREGAQAIRNFTPELRLLVKNGLTIGKQQEFNELVLREQGKIRKAIDKVPGAKRVKDALVALMQQQTEFLFNHLGPNLKVMSALLEYKHQLRKNAKRPPDKQLSVDEIASHVANVVNDDFGGLNLQKMRRDPLKQRMMRFFLLAPDWTESNVRSMVRAFKRGEEGELYRELWGRVIGKAAAAAILANYVMSVAFAPWDDEDFVERYKSAWEEGNLRWMDVDITGPYRALGGSDDKRKYFSIIGHFRDPVKFVVHPAKSASHKSSVVMGTVTDAVFSRDWAGRPFTTWSEFLGIDEKGVYQTGPKRGKPKGGQLAGETVSFRSEAGGGIGLEWSQFPSFAVSQARGVAPIQIQNLLAFLGGEMDAFDAISKSMGLMTSTTHPESEDKKKRRTR